MKTHFPDPSPELVSDQSFTVLSLLALMKQFSLSITNRDRMLFVWPVNMVRNRFTWNVLVLSFVNIQ